MSDAVKRVEKYLDNFESVGVKGGYIASCGSIDTALSAEDIRAIIEENKRLRDACDEIRKYDDGGFCGRIAYCAVSSRSINPR